jgi:hypothetical protein
MGGERGKGALYKKFLSFSRGKKFLVRREK